MKDIIRRHQICFSIGFFFLNLVWMTPVSLLPGNDCTFLRSRQVFIYWNVSMFPENSHLICEVELSRVRFSLSFSSTECFPSEKIIVKSWNYSLMKFWKSLNQSSYLTSFRFYYHMKSLKWFVYEPKLLSWELFFF